jgi:hypothetical protein
MLSHPAFNFKFRLLLLLLFQLVHLCRSLATPLPLLPVRLPLLPVRCYKQKQRSVWSWPKIRPRQNLPLWPLPLLPVRCYKQKQRSLLSFGQKLPLLPLQGYEQRLQGVEQRLQGYEQRLNG